MCFRMEGGSPLENVLPTELMKFFLEQLHFSILERFLNLLKKQVLVSVNLLFFTQFKLKLKRINATRFKLSRFKADAQK